MSRRENGNRWERNRYYQIRDGHRNHHSDKEYKRATNRAERHAVSQACHMACLDPEVDTYYNRRDDWDHFMPHSVPYSNWWYTNRPVWMRKLASSYPSPTAQECKHLPQWMQHKIHENQGKLTHLDNRERFDQERQEAKKLAWARRYPYHPGSWCDCRECEYQKKYPKHPGIKCNCDTCVWKRIAGYM